MCLRVVSSLDHIRFTSVHSGLLATAIGHPSCNFMRSACSLFVASSNSLASKTAQVRCAVLLVRPPAAGRNAFPV